MRRLAVLVVPLLAGEHPRGRPMRQLAVLAVLAVLTLLAVLTVLAVHSEI